MDEIKNYINGANTLSVLIRDAYIDNNLYDIWKKHKVGAKFTLIDMDSASEYDFNNLEDLVEFAKDHKSVGIMHLRLNLGKYHSMVGRYELNDYVVKYLDSGISDRIFTLYSIAEVQETYDEWTIKIKLGQFLEL